MKKYLRNLVALVILLIVICTVGTVNAASVSMSLTSESKLVAGETIEVTLKISGIDAGNGVDAIIGTLNYDKNVFEEVTDESFEGINKWNVMAYNKDTQIFTATRSAKVNMQSDILKITLRAKAAVTVNSSIIEIKDISTSGGDLASGGTGDITVQAVNVTINKVSSITPITNEQTNTVVNNVVNNKVNTTNVIKSNTANTTNLPKTGEEDGIVLAIAAVAIVSIIAYVRYRKINIK